MRKWVVLAVLSAGLLSMASLGPNRAEAMTIGAPAGLATAAGETDLAQDAAYVCRRVWRHGWRRHCWWTGPRAGYYGYGWRRHRHWHHRRHWRHRPWRRW